MDRKKIQTIANGLVIVSSVLALYLSYRALPLSPARIEVGHRDAVEMFAFANIFAGLNGWPIEHYYVHTPGLSQRGRVNIRNAKYKTFSIKNTGAKSFDWDRFTNELTFVLDSEGTILDARVSGRMNDDDVGVLIEHDPDYKSFTLRTDYLNSREAISVSVLFLAKDDSWDVKGRIKDHPVIKLKSTDSTEKTVFELTGYKKAIQTFSLIVIVWWPFVYLYKKFRCKDSWLRSILSSMLIGYSALSVAFYMAVGVAVLTPLEIGTRNMLSTELGMVALLFFVVCLVLIIRFADYHKHIIVADILNLTVKLFGVKISDD